jgi:undecaprenyl-diphosphatase
MSMIEGIVLGLLEGVTQFLPVSTLGHVILIRDLLSLDEVHLIALTGVINVVIGLATILYFWSDIWTVLQALLRKLGRLPVNNKDLVLLKALLLGMIPAVVVGFFSEPYIYTILNNASLVSAMLLAASIFFMYAEWRYYVRPVHEQVTVKNGFFVGLFQIFSLLPGFPRTGAVMAGGMLLGMSRFEAVRFSFLLAIPTTMVIGTRKLLSVITSTGPIDWAVIIVGGTVAFFSALLCIHLFLSYARKYTLWPFIWYGVVLAALVGYVSLIS